jgi:1,4-dihydroxy-2-naphthoate octaprenyltransferase
VSIILAIYYHYETRENYSFRGCICLSLIVNVANIMLANNICDMEDDFINRRLTLGKENALTFILYSSLRLIIVTLPNYIIP